MPSLYPPQRDPPFKLFFKSLHPFARLHPFCLAHSPSAACLSSPFLCLAHLTHPLLSRILCLCHLCPSFITPDTPSLHNLSEFFFLRISKMTENESPYTFQCPLDDCGRWFKNLTGLTQHIRAKHPNEDVDMNGCTLLD